ncbi:MAG: ring-cleaving dioxygenase [Chloroflexi bacterium HGW-Chloroflexi-8]|nr:MAG: ring-cleaving dioxygenase [Chloroflexi bacterium HGW-Chloroflexi-8]
MKTLGLHHITAAAKDPQTNLDFYQQILGQRLTKTTVNFDDPGTYHFYYGDYTGTPGTALTFFPWAHINAGQPGNREAAAFSYSIPHNSLSFWAARLKQFGYNPSREDIRFGDAVLPFQDPDGLHLELITLPSQSAHISIIPTLHSNIPEEHQLRGFNSVTLWLDEVEPTARVLTEVLGLTFIGQEGHRYRYSTQSDELGQIIDIVHRPNAHSARFGAGSIHHIAFRAQTDQQQLDFRSAVQHIGIPATEVIDRQYFHSVYFRTPGGVLFEIATDLPGFATDEPLDALGQTLKLPVWFESRRAMIEQNLAPIDRNRKIAYVR